jgi:hypothetical protein
MKLHRIYPLNEVIRSYDVILPDTSTLSNFFSVHNVSVLNSIGGKKLSSEKQFLSYSFWKTSIEENTKNNVLFCEGILDELKGVRKIKFRHHYMGKYIDPNFKKFSRNTLSAAHRKNNLLKVLNLFWKKKILI